MIRSCSVGQMVGRSNGPDPFSSVVNIPFEPIRSTITTIRIINIYTRK